ncbi:uncharacterized protein KD926_005561 [Aspergillus affinis]|uniref:uncharacterized protein n=1 Tax=Aspergillus affinis TaxID=1070780 RepID=UPI0022FEE5A5|nr:uncharacterized protein KD926_005561 [Aspergillus affinis]KAI9042480.1 hypothetical protein KD926_005561 [Aspergillus affinis]
MADTIQVPPNDPQNPRWLLDLEEWKVKPFTEVPRGTLEREGYGIVSYTWGYIADYENLPTDIPDGISWDVPGTRRWPLSEARRIMGRIGTRYVWWDWMCVPQGNKGRMRPLSPQLQAVQGEEIGKQMHIYRKAKNSIVWLHTTFWQDESALKALLLSRPRDGNPAPTTAVEYLDQVRRQLVAAQDGEWWLRSGWTLQEGVLLGPTHLVDVNGEKLEDDRFLYGGCASVLDITIRITRLAVDLAQAFVIQAEGQEADGSTPRGQLAEALANPNSARALRQSLKSLINSGLVGYTEYSPLYILAGKQSRTFGVSQDACWALLGAMGLDGVKVDYNVPMEEIKRVFLTALIKRYQWTMLLLPLPEFQVKELRGQEVYMRDFAWTDIVDGVLLPIGVCVDTLIRPKSPPTNPTPPRDPEKDPEEKLRRSLPTLTYTDTLRIKPREDGGGTLVVYSGEKQDDVWFRHYCQNSDGLRIVTPRVAGPEDEDRIHGAWFLPLEDLDVRNKVQGKRCLVLFRFNSKPPDAQPAYGDFGGICDIWGIGSNKVDVHEIMVNPGL